jgi:RHS repeat-associated protein
MDQIAQEISYIIAINRIAYSNNKIIAYYTHDLRDSIVNDSATKNTGIAYHYQAYGLINSASVNHYQYNKEYYDQHTGLLYLRARFYHPGYKIFITQDTYDLFNKFNFVNGNPIMYQDPSGHLSGGGIAGITSVGIVGLPSFLILMIKIGIPRLKKYLNTRKLKTNPEATQNLKTSITVPTMATESTDATHTNAIEKTSPNDISVEFTQTHQIDPTNEGAFKQAFLSTLADAKMKWGG